MLIIISKENWVKLMMSLKIHTFRVFLNPVSECPGDDSGAKDLQPGLEPQSLLGGRRESVSFVPL